MVSRSEKGFDTTGSRLKAVAIKEADAFCILSGKALEIIKSTQKIWFHSLQTHKLKLNSDTFQINEKAIDF